MCFVKEETSKNKFCRVCLCVRRVVYMSVRELACHRRAISFVLKRYKVLISFPDAAAQSGGYGSKKMSETECSSPSQSTLLFLSSFVCWYTCMQQWYSFRRMVSAST